MDGPRRCNRSSSSFEPVEKKAEMPKHLSEGSHEGSLSKYFLLVEEALKGQSRIGLSYLVRL